MSDPSATPAEEAGPDEEPTTDQLQEPSTEKDPGEEPKAAKPHDPEPSHQAVGIGVVDGPQFEGAEESDGGAGGT